MALYSVMSRAISMHPRVKRTTFSDGISALDSIAKGAISSGMQAFAEISALMKEKAFDRALEDNYLIQTKVASLIQGEMTGRGAWV